MNSATLALAMLAATLEEDNPTDQNEAADTAALGIIAGNIGQLQLMNEQIKVMQKQAEAAYALAPFLSDHSQGKTEIARKVVNLLADIEDVITDWSQATAEEIEEINPNDF